MGTDQAFAAQMWNWPDPAIKRDSAGGVVFVNAAFLGLYGGRAEDWHGMMVTGWNAPPAPGQGQRFETRIPGQAGERVFDWVESALGDGSALALARDVTAIAAPPTPPGGQPLQHTPPAADIAAAQAMAANQAIAANAPVHVPARAEPVFEPVLERAVAHDPGVQSPARPDASTTAARPVETNTPVETVAPVEAIASAAPEIDLTEDFLAVDAEPDPVLSSPVTPTTTAPTEEKREFERRALPIETDSAVLGNNWRDAVIAKAVGAEGATAPEPEADPADAHPVAEARVAGEPIRILLAEDNAINALLTRTLLEAEGCTVETVEDGALAVEAVRNARYDLIFMDMRMPNMDGLESTRKIRSMDHRSKGLPIIALTANAFDDDRNACFDAGMNDFMTKPVSAEELSEMVTRWTAEDAPTERSLASAV